MDCFEDVHQDDSGTKADARREGVAVEQVKAGVNGSTEPPADTAADRNLWSLERDDEHA